MIARLAVRTRIGPTDLLAAPPEVIEEMIDVITRQDREERARSWRDKMRGSK